MIPVGGNKAAAKSWGDGQGNDLTWLQIRTSGELVKQKGKQKR